MTTDDEVYAALMAGKSDGSMVIGSLMYAYDKRTQQPWWTSLCVFGKDDFSWGYNDYGLCQQDPDGEMAKDDRQKFIDWATTRFGQVIACGNKQLLFETVPNLWPGERSRELEKEFLAGHVKRKSREHKKWCNVQRESRCNCGEVFLSAR
jgi:hypothetical protein